MCVRHCAKWTFWKNYLVVRTSNFKAISLIAPVLPMRKTKLWEIERFVQTAEVWTTVMWFQSLRSALLPCCQNASGEVGRTATHLCGWQLVHSPVQICLPETAKLEAGRGGLQESRLVLLKFSLPWFHAVCGSVLKFTHFSLGLKFCVWL